MTEKKRNTEGQRNAQNSEQGGMRGAGQGKGQGGTGTGTGKEGSGTGSNREDADVTRKGSERGTQSDRSFSERNEDDASQKTEQGKGQPIPRGDRNDESGLGEDTSL